MHGKKIDNLQNISQGSSIRYADCLLCKIKLKEDVHNRSYNNYISYLQ